MNETFSLYFVDNIFFIFETGTYFCQGNFSKLFLSSLKVINTAEKQLQSDFSLNLFFLFCLSGILCSLHQSKANANANANGSLRQCGLIFFKLFYILFVFLGLNTAEKQFPQT